MSRPDLTSVQPRGTDHDDHGALTSAGGARMGSAPGADMFSAAQSALNNAVPIDS